MLSLASAATSSCQLKSCETKFRDVVRPAVFPKTSEKELAKQAGLWSGSPEPKQFWMAGAEAKHFWCWSRSLTLGFRFHSTSLRGKRVVQIIQ